MAKLAREFRHALTAAEITKSIVKGCAPSMRLPLPATIAGAIIGCENRKRRGSLNAAARLPVF